MIILNTGPLYCLNPSHSTLILFKKRKMKIFKKIKNRNRRDEEIEMSGRNSINRISEITSTSSNDILLIYNIGYECLSPSPGRDPNISNILYFL